MEILLNCLEMLIRKADNNPQGRHVHLGTLRLLKLKPISQLNGWVLCEIRVEMPGEVQAEQESRECSLSKSEPPN